MPTFSLFLPDEAATDRLGAVLATRLRPRDVVALVGGLGAGKTTLARAILRAASGEPALVVPSPTFTLAEIYDTPKGTFWHFDLYRLEAPEQVQERVAVLAPGHADHDPVVRRDQPVVPDGLANLPAQALLQLVEVGFFLAGKLLHDAIAGLA